MKRFTKHDLAAALLVVAALAVAALPASAEEPAKKPAKEQFAVYAGNCSRSIKLVSTHDDAGSACWAAAALRRDNKIVRITTGKVEEFLLTPNPKTCSVYGNPCKFWYLAATTRGTWEADVLAEAICKKGESAEIIYHYTQP
jgi:hypothetical protein